MREIRSHWPRVEILIRADGDGSAIRLKDVARVELGSKDYDFIGRINGKPASEL